MSELEQLRSRVRDLEYELNQLKKENLQVYITEHFNAPTTCKVIQNGLTLFDGMSLEGFIEETEATRKGVL